MAVTNWAPSFLGRHLTGSFNWHLRLDGFELVLTAEGRTHRVHAEEETAYHIQPSMLWTDITLYPGQGAEVKADGLPNTQGATLTHALNLLLTEMRLREDVAFHLGTLQTIEQWLEFKASQEQHCTQKRRWVTYEQQAAVIAARPSVGAKAIRARVKKPRVTDRLGPKANAVERSLIAWETDPYSAWARLNLTHTERELKDCKELLDRVESKPLTAEQARAVICFDNRVQVVARQVPVRPLPWWPRHPTRSIVGLWLPSASCCWLSTSKQQKS